MEKSNENDKIRIGPNPRLKVKRYKIKTKTKRFTIKKMYKAKHDHNTQQMIESKVINLIRK